MWVSVYVQGRDADFSGEGTHIARWASMEERWMMLEAWLKGGRLGAGFLLKVCMVGGGNSARRDQGGISDEDRSKVQGA